MVRPASASVEMVMKLVHSRDYRSDTGRILREEERSHLVFLDCMKYQ
jgi:hypothetical protein